MVHLQEVRALLRLPLLAQGGPIRLADGTKALNIRLDGRREDTKVVSEVPSAALSRCNSERFAPFLKLGDSRIVDIGEARWFAISLDLF